MNSITEISVLTATHNDGRYIAHAVESILNQTYEQFEYIIIDDASTDETTDILKAYAAQDSRISLYRNEQKLGRSLARNRGLSLVNGQWIAVFDGDDISHPKRLERQRIFLEENPSIDYLGTGCSQIDKQTSENLPDLIFVPLSSSHQIIWRLCFDFPFHHSSTIGRKDVILSAGGYPAEFPVCEDIYLWMRMALNGARFANLKDKLLTYRVNTRPNHYALNQVIAEQLHRNFVQQQLNTRITPEAFEFVWQTNKEWLNVPDRPAFALNAIEAVNTLTQLYYHFSTFSPCEEDEEYILSDTMKRIAKISELAFFEGVAWASPYQYGY